MLSVRSLLFFFLISFPIRLPNKALVEILLLSGGTPYANFKHLAHAWGREKGFHNVLANAVCDRRGEVERKKRSDAGRTLTDEQKEAFKQKLKRVRLSKSSINSSKNNNSHGASGTTAADTAAAAGNAETSTTSSKAVVPPSHCHREVEVL